MSIESFVVHARGRRIWVRPWFDGNITDSKSSGLFMSIGGRDLVSEDSDVDFECYIFPDNGS